jgi:hypothetical protein
MRRTVGLADIVKPYWPEIATAVGCVVLLGLIQPFYVALLLTGVLYVGLRWADSLNRKTDSPKEQTVQDLLAEFGSLRNRPQLAPFRKEIDTLAYAVQAGFATELRSDAGLREATRVMLAEVVKSTRTMAELSFVPTGDDDVSRQYRDFLGQCGDQLTRMYVAARKQDAAAVAEQIKSSAQFLQSIQQEVSNGQQ